ncbi:hypothetical protein CXB51_017815 [Gossypium anomalum]|uniref:Uncharacterized protein n=1 Tax=Gossypium anomalum TaxID=47600 RepID=A0A8J6D0Y3_9ROSI|nr:hypothetical protein CXB51_017815 [Gossypium anomalum]
MKSMAISLLSLFFLYLFFYSRNSLMIIRVFLTLQVRKQGKIVLDHFKNFQETLSIKFPSKVRESSYLSSIPPELSLLLVSFLFNLARVIFYHLFRF